MQKSNLFTSMPPVAPNTTIPPMPKASSSASFVDLMPSINDALEKKQFIKTIIVSTIAFSFISAIVVGFILTNRLTQVNGQANQPLKPIYTDGGEVATQVVARKPTRAIVPVTALVDVPTPIPFITTKVPTPTSASPLVVTIRIITPSFTPTLAAGSLPGGQTGSQPTASPPTTLTPTPIATFTPTPTPVLYVSAESLNFGSQVTGSSTEQAITMRNIGSSTIVITTLDFSTTGGLSPYSINNGISSCLTNAELPYSLTSNASRCINFRFAPASNSTTSNTFLINTSLKSISLQGIVMTPTPTPTFTPTPTPTPTP